MTHTVGIIGAGGRLGSQTARLLAEAAEWGKIKLVIFYRKGGTTTNLPNSRHIEIRHLDLDGPLEKIEGAVRGINIFISTLGFGALPKEPNLVDALAKSPDLLVYVPSTYSTTWEHGDFLDPQIGPILAFMHAGWERAKQRDISTCTFYVGSFENFFFQAGFVGAPLKDNTVWANENQLRNPFPITVIKHLAESLAGVATSDLQSIKNKEFSVVTFWPTGQDLVHLYTKLHGRQAQIKPLTKADQEAMSADAGNYGPMRLGYWDRWENNTWRYASGGKIVDKAYIGPSIEEVARRFL